MFTFSEVLLEEFQKIHKEKYGTDITLEEADAELRSLMGLVKIVTPEEKLKKGVSNENKVFPAKQGQ